MKQNSYQVYFSTTKYVDVYAFNRHEAVILAQAKRIENGESYDVAGVKMYDWKLGDWIDVLDM